MKYTLKKLSTSLDEGGDESSFSNCPACGASNVPMGVLGTRRHYRCRDCGIEWSEEGGDVER